MLKNKKMERAKRARESTRQMALDAWYATRNELIELLPGNSDLAEFYKDYGDLEWDQQLGVSCGTHQVDDDLVSIMKRYRH